MIIPLLYALCCLIWGSTWLVIKIGLIGVPPFLGAGLRFLLASMILMALVAARRASLRLTSDDKTAILSCGFVSFGLSYACVYWAEQYISSGLTAILYCTMPLVVALLSAFWTRAETLSLRKVTGIFIAIAGTTVLFWPSDKISRLEIWGMVIVLFSTASAAVNLVTLKKYGKHTDIYVLNGLGMAIGAACLLALSFFTESYQALAWSRANILAIVYLAVAGSVMAFLAYCYLIKVMEATKLSLITLIFPIVAVILGNIFLHESVTAATGAGMLIVLAGVAISII